MNIENMTYGELKKIANLFNQTKCEELLAEEGKSYFIRTVTHHYTGKCVKVTPNFIELTDAAWIADDGRFYDFLKTGNANEVEPFVNNVKITTGAILDITEWYLALPKEQK